MNRATYGICMGIEENSWGNHSDVGYFSVSVMQSIPLVHFRRPGTKMTKQIRLLQLGAHYTTLSCNGYTQMSASSAGVG